MKSKFISAAVLSVAALTSMGASAEIYNSWMFDQMAAPATKTRAEVKAEVLQAQRSAVSGSAFNGATAQRNISAPALEKTGTAPQTAAGQVKTSQQ
jgi:hypothetical protein